MQRKLAIAAAALIAVTSLVSIAFWWRLPRRLPTDEDYRAANTLIASKLQPKDVIVLAPAWADRGKQFLTAAPTYAGFDLEHDVYQGAKRQWLVALADAPRVDLQEIRHKLSSRGTAAAEGVRIGGLWVEPFVTSPDVLYSFMDEVPNAKVSLATPKGNEECRKLNNWHQCSRGPWNHVRPEWHELDEKPIHCIWAHAIDNGALRIQYDDVPLHGKVHGWAALVGDAVVAGGFPVDLQLEVNGQVVQTTSFPNEPGKRDFDIPLPAGGPERGRVAFLLSASNAFRRFFCFDAWVQK